MGVALQCPECGFKHRLDAVGDRDVFPCAQCARELKVPTAYRTGAASANGTDETVRRAPAGGSRAAPRPRPKHQVGAAPMRLPVRILLWVVAFVLGALIVRSLAKVTGFAGGDTFFDLLVDGSIGTYVRLLALVPVWALFATLLATAFIDGPRVWARRHAGRTSAPSGTAATVRRPKPASGAATGAKVAAAGAGGAVAGAAATKRSIPRREPAPVATPGPRSPTATEHLPDPPPVAPAVTRTAAVAAAATSSSDDEDASADFSERAAAGQRPRRIPRRGAAS